MRRRIYEIIEVGAWEDKFSRAYDIFMIVTIIVSIIPLAFKGMTPLFVLIEKVTVWIFIVDYILRLITADFKLCKGKASFIRYPFTFMAIVDLLSILPALIVLNNSFKLLRFFRLFRAMRAIRVFKLFRYSKGIRIILNIFEKQKESLTIVGALVLGYILISAFIVFSVEPGTFNSFFEAVYWATISMTSIGYGDIVPTSFAGRAITIISALVGIAIIALPASIITAGYIEEVNLQKYEEEDYSSKYDDIDDTGESESEKRNEYSDEELDVEDAVQKRGCE